MRVETCGICLHFAGVVKVTPPSGREACVSHDTGRENAFETSRRWCVFGDFSTWVFPMLSEYKYIFSNLISGCIWMDRNKARVCAPLYEKLRV